VLVIYKVLALVCAWSKSGSITTTVSKYVPALRQKCNNVPASRQKYNLITIYDMSLTLSTYNVLVIYKVLALVCAWSKSDR
jgi:hypothetical protein